MLHHASDTRPIDPWALPPVPLSSLAEPRLLAQGAPRRLRGYFILKVSAMRLSVPLYYPRVPDRFSIITHALGPGKTVWFKRLYPGIPLYNRLTPPLLCARGVSRQRGNSLYTPLNGKHFGRARAIPLYMSVHMVDGSRALYTPWTVVQSCNRCRSTHIAAVV